MSGSWAQNREAMLGKELTFSQGRCAPQGGVTMRKATEAGDDVSMANWPVVDASIRELFAVHHGDEYKMGE